MIDYHAHAAGLDAIRNALDAMAGGDHAAAWDETRGALAAGPGFALLGSLFDHLLERAESAGREHELLEEAAALFAEASAALAGVAAARVDLEALVKAPDAATTDQFNAATDRLRVLEPKLNELRVRVQAFQGKLIPPFRHVRPHGIASDLPVSKWSWRDVVLSRRTDALVAAFQAAGDGPAATRAFAFGALAGHAANCVGSAYQAHAVRGPRRSHPLRDRLARYAVGAWFRTHQPALSPSLAELRARLLADAPTLPAAIRDQIQAALAAAYPAGAPAAGPDLDAGYANLLRHLELLASFGRPPIPPDIDATLLVRVLQSPTATKSLVSPQDHPPFDDPPPGMPGHDPLLPPSVPGTGPGQDTTGDGGCGWILLGIILVPLLIYFLIHKADEGRWPWEPEPADPAETPGKSVEALKAYLKSEDALVTVSYLFNAHTLLAQVMAFGLKYLKTVGLIYPDEIDLSEETFAQFTALSLSAGGAYPHRPVPDEDFFYRERPTSPIEEPGTRPSSYPVGATPEAFLADAAGGALPTIGPVGAELWLRHQAAPGGDRENRNADADRGEGHLCWRVAPGQSIATNPVPVTLLGFDEVD